MLFTVWALETGLTVLEIIPGMGPIATLLRSLIDKLKIAYGMVKTTVDNVVTEVKAAKKGAEKLKGSFTQGLPSREDLEALRLGPLPTQADCAKKPETSVNLTPLPESKKAEILKEAQAGGALALLATVQSDSSILPFLLVSTIGLIIVSSIVLSLRRSMQKNEPAKPDQRRGEKDDVPPEPGTSGTAAPNAKPSLPGSNLLHSPVVRPL
jgi:hypothetical protein